MNNKPDQKSQFIASSHLLGPDQIRFERTKGGLVKAHLPDGTQHEPVDFYRAFPFSAPDGLISVRDERDSELGIISSLASFSAAEKHIVRTELNRRYFAPLITRILELRERYGQSQWRVDTEAGPVEFTVQNEHANLQDLPNGRLLLLDINGNRYHLNARDTLPTRIRRKLEAIF